MDMEFAKIRSIVASQMNISERKITLNTSFTDDLGADSLDLFQITSEIEEAFDLEFDIEETEKLKTVADAVEYIKGHCS